MRYNDEDKIQRQVTEAVKQKLGEDVGNSNRSHSGYYPKGRGEYLHISANEDKFRNTKYQFENVKRIETPQKASDKSNETQKSKAQTKTKKKKTDRKTKGKAKQKKMNDYDKYQPDDIDTQDEEALVIKRKRHPIRTILLTLLIVVFVVALAASLMAWRYIGMVNVVETGERQNLNVNTMSSSDVKNILLIGTDTRTLEEKGRSDSVILVSLDMDNREMTMTSFMRDSYVEIPGRGWNRLNAAYAYGGAELLMDTLEYNFHVKIDDYVFISFYSFIDIIDAIGGIEMNVTAEEINGINGLLTEQNNLLGNPKGTDCIKGGGGTYMLNGNQALGYARIRHVGNADFERTERQRLVISKIFEKVKTLNPFEINSFIEATAKSITTNMTKGEMFKLYLKALYIATFDTQDLRIPVDKGFSYATIDGMSVLKIDFDKNINVIKEKIYD